MITIKSDIPHVPSLGEPEYSSLKEALSLLHTYLLPLKDSDRTIENRFYLQAKDSFEYFARKYDLKDIFSPFKEINSWQFLSLLSNCWKNLHIGNNNGDVQEIQHRHKLEDIGVRILNKYYVINTCLFKGQEHYSIFGADIRLINKSLKEIINTSS